MPNAPTPSSLSPPSIPTSTATVSLSVIDNGARIRNIETSLLFEDPVPGHDTMDVPSYCFLIEHARSKTRLLFDLGLREDWEGGVAAFCPSLQPQSQSQPRPPSSPSLSSLLSPNSVTALIWSHHHWDHVGNPSLLPASTPLIVGPGFKKAHLPGPSRRRAVGHAPRLDVAGLAAIDLFSDGNLYLLDAPGHTTRHVCALARTGPTSTDKASNNIDFDVHGHDHDHDHDNGNGNGDGEWDEDESRDERCETSEFVLLAADALHHPGEMLPDAHTPLPRGVAEGYGVPKDILARTSRPPFSPPDASPSTETDNSTSTIKKGRDLERSDRTEDEKRGEKEKNDKREKEKTGGRGRRRRRRRRRNEHGYPLPDPPRPEPPAGAPHA
ncbi:MAG: hypothetical protein LQ340_007790 [Diploschistes diacapsis]|nr:MAG: hypothetical protein LQ340_007790 [Diploschistes diacapsis]